VDLWGTISQQKPSIQFIVANSLKELSDDTNLLRLVCRTDLGQPYSAVTHSCDRVLFSKLAKQLGMGPGLFIGGNTKVATLIAEISQRFRIQKNIQIPNNLIVQRHAETPFREECWFYHQ
jgi:hypothetical protein